LGPGFFGSTRPAVRQQQVRRISYLLAIAMAWVTSMRPSSLQQAARGFKALGASLFLRAVPASRSARPLRHGAALACRRLLEACLPLLRSWTDPAREPRPAAAGRLSRRAAQAGYLGRGGPARGSPGPGRPARRANTAVAASGGKRCRCERAARVDFILCPGTNGRPRWLTIDEQQAWRAQPSTCPSC